MGDVRKESLELRYSGRGRADVRLVLRGAPSADTRLRRSVDEGDDSAPQFGDHGESKRSFKGSGGDQIGRRNHRGAGAGDRADEEDDIPVGESGLTGNITLCLSTLRL